MKQKKLLMLIAMVLVVVLCASVLTACKKKEQDPKKYTLRDTIGAGPTNFNPHTWETDADNYLAPYTEMGLVDTTIAKDGVNFEWVYEMATSVTDVTAEYLADPEKVAKWEIDTEKETAGKVYRIALNPAAKWANGEAINADTYVESMKALLDPKMRNYRANTYYDGSAAVKNAYLYYSAESPIYKPVVPAYGEEEAPDYSFDISKKEVYINLDVAMTVATYSYAQLKSLGFITDDESYGALKEAANAYGYIKVTDKNKAQVLSITDQYLSAFGMSIYTDAEKTKVNENLFKEFLFYNTGEFAASYDWSNVGLLKVDDYTIDYVVEGTEEEFYFLTSLTSNWIVYLPLYNQLKSQVGELATTKYGTSVDTYMSYGPYKLVSYEKDKQIKMTRNENWYGWTDGQHVGQFQTTDIVADIISDDSTLEGLFLSGKIDSLSLNSSQLANYRNSENLLKTDQTYTFRFVFASDLTALKGLEAKYNNGKNLQVLSYDDFRKAISLSLNRTEFAAQATGGYKPAYSLYNSIYYYNVAEDPESIYRRTDEAKQAIVDLYGIEYGADKTYKTLDDAYKAITGYDVESAKALFQSVYKQAVKDGRYTDGQEILIHCDATGAKSLSEDDIAQQRLLNQYVAAATKGTGFEGKISFEFRTNTADRYADITAGKVEMIRGAWGGAAFYPFSAIRCYVGVEYQKGIENIHESCGWDPRAVKLSLTYDFDGDGNDETWEYDLEQWSVLINGGGKLARTGDKVYTAVTDAKAKLYIMSQLEKTVLSAYQCIPFASQTVCSLFSHKIRYATLNYNVMYGYGGLRLMTYNYTDMEWDNYVKSQNNKLSY